MTFTINECVRLVLTPGGAKLLLWPKNYTEILHREISPDGAVRWAHSDGHLELMLTDDHVAQIGQAVREHQAWIAACSPRKTQVA